MILCYTGYELLLLHELEDYLQNYGSSQDGSVFYRQLNKIYNQFLDFFFLTADCREGSCFSLRGLVLIFWGLILGFYSYANNFSSLLLDVYSYVQLNMFRASLRPSSGAQQLQ